MHRLILGDIIIGQTMNHQMLTLFTVTTLVFFAFPTSTTAYKAKTDGQEVVTEPMVDAKIIEIEHTTEPKTSYESGMYYNQGPQKGYVLVCDRLITTGLLTIKMFFNNACSTPIPTIKAPV